MDPTIGTDLLRLVAVALLVLANGFFVAAEFSLVSVRGTRIKELVAQGNSAAKWAAKALENPDQVIAATQLGITLASLGLGWVGEPALSHLLLPLIEKFPADLQEGASHSIAAGISFAIITFLHVVVGELAPKSIALQNPEDTALVVARPTLVTETIFKPFIWALNGTGNALLRLVGVDPAAGHELVHSVEELKMIVAASAQEGVVADEESQMLHAIFDFGELLVRRVMIPRTEISAFEADIYLNEAIEQAVHSSFTKFPIYDDDLDNIIGIVHIKDLLRAERDPEKGNCKIRELARDPYFVPESVPVRTLLQQFRAQRRHIAIVMDEFGGTAGLVTLEDLMEEIVGEVSDPFDTEEPEVQKSADGSAVLDGLLSIDEVNRELGLALHDENYDTIAGFVFGQLNRIPVLGDVVEFDSARFTVQEMDGRRIARLKFERL